LNEKGSRINDSLRKDSLIKAIRAKMPRISMPDGILGLKWQIQKDEAIKILKHKDSIKITLIDKEDEYGQKIECSGWFAGKKTKKIILSFYSNKFCEADIDFGFCSQNFADTICSRIEKKYQKKGIKGQYGISLFFNSDMMEDPNKYPVITTIDDEIGFNLYYTGPYFEKLKKDHQEEYLQKHSAKIKDKDL
jgi:hypothetical protein